jgi:predicted DNA-binding transcriptional regulator AlpA
VFNKPKPTLVEELDLIPEPEFAAFMGKSLPSIRNDRSRGRTPPFIKLGNKIWFRRKDVLAFVTAKTVTPKTAPTLVQGRPGQRTPAPPRRRRSQPTPA